MRCRALLDRTAEGGCPYVGPSLSWQLALIPGMRFYYSHANFSLLSPGCHPHSPTHVSGDDRCLLSCGERQVHFLCGHLYAGGEQEQRDLCLPVRRRDRTKHALGTGGGDYEPIVRRAASQRTFSLCGKRPAELRRQE